MRSFAIEEPSSPVPALYATLIETPVDLYFSIANSDGISFITVITGITESRGVKKMDIHGQTDHKGGGAAPSALTVSKCQQNFTTPLIFFCFIIFSEYLKIRLVYQVQNHAHHDAQSFFALARP